MPEENENMLSEDEEVISDEEVPAELPIDTEEVDEQDVDYHPEEFDQGVAGRVDSMMKDLNLSRKHFVIFAGCFTLLIVGIIFSFIFLFSLFGGEPEEVVVEPTVVEEEKEGFFNRLFGGGKDEPEEMPEAEPEEKPEEELEEDEEGQEPASDVDEEERSTVTPAVETGGPPAKVHITNSIRASVFYGESEISEDRLAYYVRTYRRVRNIFNTDLFSFLNTVPDRGEGYDAFLTQFKGANEQAKLAFEDLRQEIADFENRLAALNEEANLIESQFFDAMDELESEALPELLSAFQDITFRRDVVKSELNARVAIGEKYQSALPFIEEKIRAIEANRDAFVKGVRVVEFEQVDLDLVIEEGE